jgi:hypothetical protein
MPSVIVRADGSPGGHGPVRDFHEQGRPATAGGFAGDRALTTGLSSMADAVSGLLRAAHS